VTIAILSAIADGSLTATERSVIPALAGLRSGLGQLRETDFFFEADLGDIGLTATG